MTPMDYVQEFDDHPMGAYLIPEQREMLAGIIAKAQAEAVKEEREACAKIAEDIERERDE